MRNLLPFDGEVYLHPAFIPEEQAGPLMRDLVAEAHWEQPTLKVYGKAHKTPRLVAWYGARDYSYSGHTHAAAAVTPALQMLWPKVEEVAGAEFNCTLLNYYRTGQDCMGWHADNEAVLGRNPTIGSLSLGALRKFRLRHNKTGEGVDVMLPAGSLLIMTGETQHHWQHCLPKSARPLGPRLNLTFRRLT